MSPPDELRPLDRLLRDGVPADALTFYGRWFQFETWLRELVYVELRAKHGLRWTDHLSGTPPARAAGDLRNDYMASADSGDLLAYADVVDLFRLIEDQWELFAPVLPPRRRWNGWTDELRELRNRNAHCRRPHPDDVARIEQVLRNLEPGAQRFYVTYLDTSLLERSRDPLSRAWIDADHEAAGRLLEHARRQYDVWFSLRYSARPWAAAPKPQKVSGCEGALWHARWVLRGGSEVRIADLWEEMQGGPAENLLVHLLVDVASVTATFSTVDRPESIADSIGAVFDCLLTVAEPRDLPDLWAETTEAYWRHWREGADRLPRRAQIDSPLTTVDPLNPRLVPIFSA